MDPLNIKILFLLLFLVGFNACGFRYSDSNIHSADTSGCSDLIDENEIERCQSRAQKSLQHNQILRSEMFQR
ncbi:MAG TPA: hypothetical protein PJ989_14145 [Oligoflexia bacterium]|nr:hypothetical protein [Oligoflexia bacterium]